MNQAETDTVRVIEEPLTDEPEAIWPNAPRFCPSRSFPEYRYVRGLNAHPSQDESGHSYGVSRTLAAITRTDWHKHEDFLFGIDLYHHGYLWESRRIWRGISAATSEDCLETSLLGALVMNSAAQIRAHRGNAQGARTYSQSARWYAARIRSIGYDGAGNRFMGFDIGDLIEQIDRHYRPVWDQEDDRNVQLMGPPPRFRPKRR